MAPNHSFDVSVQDTIMRGADDDTHRSPVAHKAIDAEVQRVLSARKIKYDFVSNCRASYSDFRTQKSAINVW